ncbi:ATP-dependent RNA helicase DeaD [Litoreibacter ascidiaceicola]|uniref:ATP-dependent RNA helicase DeaD n=1 Tax=Litoreibacter ascidiaceicola TaxID=1486859 RepID=A0A1M5APM5_9RHOB|nr:DEAD/DEAH box helicase [Litoreibacter ascidiaceicola]SHF32189.1 ATP-dependent RNA helicase DeaD [Litoreibacter ascidiaceicola]
MIQSIQDALTERGYTDLTPVQTAVTDDEYGNADLLVSAQTGSGKTVAFGLAIAPTLLGDELKFGRAAAPLALVIAPTRELALQVKRELSWLYAKAGAVVASCVGGMDMRDERRALDRGAHIVVATPGRLRDHIQRSSIDLSEARAVVLDEADEMLDLGFREDLEFILSEAPESRRTLMFSATVPASIAKLAKSYQKDAIRVSTKAENSQHSDIEYRAMAVAPRDAENSLINVLRYYEAPTAIVFCNTRAMVNRLTTRFSNRGFSVVALSGELSQNERTHALQSMRDGRARVCVATDVAARGIDLPNLELVIHAELPNNHETLLHRSGRTGRAGRKGVSAMIVPAKMRRKAERLLQGAKVKAEWVEAPSADDVNARDEERLFNDPVWVDTATDSEAGLVAKLVERFSPEQIATAYTRLFRERQSAPEDLAPSGSDAPKERPAFGESVWFSISVGRKDNAEPRWLLPAMCRAGDLTKDDIGAIRIQQNASFVEILKTSVDGFLKALGDGMKLEDGAIVTRLDKAPDFTSMPRPQGGAGKKPYEKKSYDKKPYDKKPYEKKPHRGDYDTPPRPAATEQPKTGKSISDARPAGAVTDHKPRPAGDKKPYEKKPFDKKGDKKPYDKKPRGDKAPYEKKGDKPAFDKKPDGKKPFRKADGDKPFRKTDGDKPRFDKKPGGKKPFNKADGGKPAGKRPAASANDTSKRFTPPGGKVKPRVNKGAGATPKRGKGKP